MLQDLADEGLSRSTISRVRSHLTSALDHAVRRRKVRWNVAKGGTMPVIAPPRKGRALTADEIVEFKAAAPEDRLGGFFLLGLGTGLRPGELCGLTWAAVDLDQATLMVESNLERDSSGAHLGGVKYSTAGERIVELSPSVVAALRTHRARQAQERLSAGPRWSQETPDLIFATVVGTALDYRRVGRRNL